MGWMGRTDLTLEDRIWSEDTGETHNLRGENTGHLYCEPQGEHSQTNSDVFVPCES